ncbi:MAG: 30S ribosomal protein S6 [Candidatus Omnitrophota bacterium]|nr:30S ribosomal protein S6 [Candidatus Omnitrophota bacterium]MDZ4242414.1 30S ribosomal protein S6 [Candidatus Omnitrophota bacterium]
MNKYELVVILDANAPQEEKDAVIKETTDAIAKGEGKIINSQVWLDKQRMSFRIQKKSEGTYYVINFESAPSFIVKLRQNLRLNERILRTLLLATH